MGNKPALLRSNSTDVQLKLERNSLRDQTKELLRDYIIGGQILPGTKLVEREVAELLGVSLRTVGDDWRLARAWLTRSLQVTDSDTDRR